MNTLSGELALPQLVAGVEVRSPGADLVAYVGSQTSVFRLQPAAASPFGFAWYELFVDAAQGERRAAHAAHSVLSALQLASDAGWLEDFRIVFGEHWLQVRDLRDSVEDMIDRAMPHRAA